MCKERNKRTTLNPIYIFPKDPTYLSDQAQTKKNVVFFSTPPL
jgi:hypothetical protein